MALSLVQGTDTVDTGLRVKVNEAINAIPTGYAISNGILTVTNFDTSTNQVTLPQQRDQVIDGGNYTQTNNLTFDIDAVTWLINNTTYNKATTTSITLGNGDVTNPRFDAIVLTTSNTVIALSGTASASPVLPTISATQLLLMSVYIPANATSGTSDATVTYWGGYTANSMAPTDPLNLYKENYISGRTPSASGDNSVAIGLTASAAGDGSIAIGYQSSAPNINAVAIGPDAQTDADNQVYIKGQSIKIETSTGDLLVNSSNIAIGTDGTPTAKLEVKSSSGEAFRVDGSTLNGILKADNDGTVNMQNIEFRYLSNTAFYRNTGNGNHIWNSANDVNNIMLLYNTGRLAVGVNPNDDLGSTDAQLLVKGIGTNATYNTKSNVSVIYRNSEVNADIVGLNIGMKTNNVYLQCTTKTASTAANMVLGGYDGVSAQLETLRLTSGGYNVSAIKTSALADGSHNNSEMSFWVDEVGNTLNFKVKYSSGTVKTGSIALV